MLRALGTSLLLVLVAVLAACGGGGGLVDWIDGPGDVGTSGMSAAELEQAFQVLDLVNAERRAVDLPDLLWDADAAHVAWRHAVDMHARSFFAHVNPDGDDPGDRLAAAGIPWSTVAENIARGQDDPAAALASWMRSPDHRANILHPLLTRLGVGVHGALGGPWWTQLFYTP